MEKPLISIIIPAYNEKKYIAECIETLLVQSYKNIELIIVDDGSTDGTKEVVKKYPLKLIEQKHGGPGAARNLGAKNSHGEILVFVDADMTFDKNYIDELVKPIIRGEATGTVHYGEKCANANNILAKFQGSPHKEGDSGHDEVFRAIRKDKFMEINGFDTARDYSDDRSLHEKIGSFPVRIPSAICYHRNAETLKEVFDQFRWRYTSYLRENGITFKFAILFGVSIGSILILFALALKNIIAGITALIFLYIIVGLAGAVKFKDWRAIVFYPPYSFTKVMSAISAFIRYLSGRGKGK